jgi:hypothetical protein
VITTRTIVADELLGDAGDEPKQPELRAAINSSPVRRMCRSSVTLAVERWEAGPLSAELLAREIGVPASVAGVHRSVPSL